MQASLGKHDSLPDERMDRCVSWEKKKDPIPISGISISDRCLGPNADVFAGFAGGSGGAAV